MLCHAKRSCLLLQYLFMRTHNIQHVKIVTQIARENRIFDVTDLCRTISSQLAASQLVNESTYCINEIQVFQNTAHKICSVSRLCLLNVAIVSRVEWLE